MKRNAITCALILGTVLMGFASASWSRETGATTSKQNYNVEAWSDDEARAFYWTGFRGLYNDFSKWEWRWDKTYSKFTTYCSGGPCNSSANETRTETIATMIGASVAGANGVSGTPIGSLTSTLTPTFQKTFTKSESFGFSWSITISSGMNAYGGVIALVRPQKNALIRGRWDRTSCSTKVLPKGGKTTTCYYKWDNDKVAGTWSGTQKSQHRTFLCTTKETLTPKVGDLLPNSCTKPQLPSGWWGG